MRNARRIWWFVGVLTITFVVLEIATTESKAINQDDRVERTQRDNTTTTNRTSVHEDNTVTDSSSGSGDDNEDNPDVDMDTSQSGHSPPPDPDLKSKNEVDGGNNTVSVRKSDVPGSSDAAPSYDPVDNTDLSLEKPDLPNNENVASKIAKETSQVRPITSQSQASQEKVIPLKNGTAIDGHPAINATGQDDEQDAELSGNSEEIFSPSGNTTNTASNNTMNKASSFGRENKTTPTTKKLFHFLEISENYTKSANPLGKSNAANVTATDDVPNAYQTDSLKARNMSIVYVPAKTKSTSPYSMPSRYSPQTKQFDSNFFSSPNKLGVARLNYTPRTPYVRPNAVTLNRFYPMSVINKDYQNARYPYQRKTYPFYRRWYQNNQKSPYRPAYQTNVRQLNSYSALNYPKQNTYQANYARQSISQAPNYAKQNTYHASSYPRQNIYQTSNFRGQVSSSRPLWYNDVVYQRSNIPRPNTVLTSKGRAPFEVFEDALLERRQKTYQNYPFYRNINLPGSAIQSIRTNPFLKSRVGSSPIANRQNIGSLYSGETNKMVPAQNAAKNPASKKQAFNVFQAAIYLADLLKNESSRIDTESSGANSIPDYLKDDDDDLNGGSERGSGDVLIKEKTKSSDNTGASVFADKNVDKLIQAEDLGKGESEGSGDNAIPEFKEANDGSGEVIDMDTTKDISDNTPTTIQTSQTGQQDQPVIITGGQAAAPQTSDAAVQPSAQVFSDNNGAAQTPSTYNYATSPAADQTNAAQTADQPVAQQSYAEQNTLPADQAAQQSYAAQNTMPADQAAQQSYAAQNTLPADQAAQQSYAAQNTLPADQAAQQSYATQPSQPADQSAQQAYGAQTQEQAAGQYYNDATAQAAPPTAQYYNDATAPDQQSASQPAAQNYNDASQQTNTAAAQYYNDAASQTGAVAQPGVQAYSSETTPQQQQPQGYYDNGKVPEAVDVAMEATRPGAEANRYTTNPAQVMNDPNGVPQSVDAAQITQQQQQAQYYTSPEQQTMQQQPAANDLTSSFMAAGNQPQMDYSTTATQQPPQYSSQPSQDTQYSQAYEETAPNGVQQRKIDVLDENKFRTVICQNNQDMISCPQGKKINIIDAHYGSMGQSDCQGPQPNFLPVQPCETPGALNVVKTSCDDMENCMLSANDELFGSQCTSDKKYLDVTYGCQDNKDCEYNIIEDVSTQFASTYQDCQTVFMGKMFNCWTCSWYKN